MTPCWLSEGPGPRPSAPEPTGPGLRSRPPAEVQIGTWKSFQTSFCGPSIKQRRQQPGNGHISSFTSHTWLLEIGENPAVTSIHVTDPTFLQSKCNYEHMLVVRLNPDSLNLLLNTFNQFDLTPADWPITKPISAEQHLPTLSLYLQQNWSVTTASSESWFTYWLIQSCSFRESLKGN